MAKTSSPKNVVVLGGSFGGISISHYLLKHVIPAIPESSSFHLTLVSASDEFFNRPASVRALISEELLPSNKVFFDIAEGFKGYSKDQFTFLHATATGLDTASRKVTVSLNGGETKDLDYYALVIATGFRATSPLLSLHTDGAAIKRAWAEFREALPRAKSIVLVGGGPTSVESAGELGDHLNGRAGFFASKLNSPKVPITIVTSNDRILPSLRPCLASQAEVYLGKVGVSVIKNTKVESVSPENAGGEDGSGDISKLSSKVTLTLSDGKTLDADLYIPATGMKPNTDFIPKNLLTDKGILDVNGTTLRVDKAGERVYALGDVANHTHGGILDLYDSIPILATNIKRDLKTAAAKAAGGAVPGGKDRPYTINLTETQLIPVGRLGGVGAFNGWKMPSFVVQAIKGKDYFSSYIPDVINGQKWEKESKWKLEG